MSQGESIPAVNPLRAAMEARDVAAVVDTFAPDAVFRSPLTSRLTFVGREQIGVLTQVLVEVLDDLRYTEQAGDGNAAFLAWRARIGGQEIEGVDQLRFGPDGKIREFTVFFRPLPAAALALRLIATGLARRKSSARAVVVSNLTRPVAAMTRAGDPIGVRLIRPALLQREPRRIGKLRVIQLERPRRRQGADPVESSRRSSATAQPTARG